MTNKLKYVIIVYIIATQKGGILKNYIDIKLYETDIIYILNCILLSKRILQDGNSEIFSHYFKKSNYYSYIYDLTNLQKVISYQANRELYEYEDNDVFIAHQYWLNHKDKNFDFLKGNERKKLVKEVNKEIKQIKQVENNRILRKEILTSLDLGIFGKKFYKKFTFSTTRLDKRKVV